MPRHDEYRRSGVDYDVLDDVKREAIALAAATAPLLSGSVGDTGTLTISSLVFEHNHIAGAGRLHSRHDAMVCGEAGADYVMFGEPDAAGHRPSREAVIDRVAWWAEVFEIPCVAYAAELGDIDALVAAGADFIAVGDAVFEDPRGLKAAAADAAMRLGITEQAT